METSASEPIVFVKWRMEESGDRFRFGVTPYYFESLVENGSVKFKPKSLFDDLPELRRSPQFKFNEIDKVRDFLCASASLREKQNP